MKYCQRNEIKAEMPNNTRSQSIEGVSACKFQLLLPSRWEYREKNKDFGVDGEVELFDEDGYATGLIFYVQLKATDSRSDKYIDSVTMKVKTLRYYFTLDLPVLIVRYSTHKDDFRIKWAESIDIFDLKPEQKTKTIRFDDADRWDGNSAANIAKRLRLIRQFKNNDIPFPYKTNISIDANAKLSCSPLVYLSQIKSEMSQYKDIVVTKDKASESVVIATVFNDRIKVEIIGLGGVVLNYKKGKYRNIGGAILIAPLIIKAISMWLIMNISPERGYAIIVKHGWLGDFIKKPTIAAVCLPKLMHSTIYESLLDGIYSLYQELIDVDLMISIPVFLCCGAVGCNDREEALAYFLVKTLPYVRAKFKDSDLGAYVYNLGNLFRGLSKFKEADYYYSEARGLSPQYLKRDYYLKEYAEILFHLNNFRLSAKRFMQAYTLKKDPILIALHANALMYNGQYKDALDEFDRFFKNLPKADYEVSEWLLKRCCLNYIVNVHSITFQNRKPEEANVIVESDYNSMESLGKAVEADALCDTAWFNLGCLEKDEANWNHAAMCYLICGLTQPNDVEAWRNAVLCLFKSNLPSENLIHVIAHAYIVNEDSFLAELYQYLYDTLGEDGANVVSQTIEAIVNDVKAKMKQGATFEVRYDGETIYSQEYDR